MPPTKEELLDLARNILETPVEKIPEIEFISERLRAINIDSPPSIYSSVHLIWNTEKPRKRTVSKKNMIYKVVLDNIDRYNVNFWIFYEQFIVYVCVFVSNEIEIYWQLDTNNPSSSDYTLLYSPYFLIYRNKTIKELLKAL